MINIIEKIIPYNLEKNILFDKFNYGENLLILYNNTSNYKQIIHNFMQQMNNKNSILFYVSHKTNQIHFNFDVRNFSFNIINENIIQNLKSKLNKYFEKIEKNNKEMFLISDWSKANLNEYEIFLAFLENLIKKSKSLIPPTWKRGYKGIRQKIHLNLINLFDTTNLNNEFIQKIIQLHERVYLLQGNSNTFLLPTLSPFSETIFPKCHILPKEILEKLVKDNLELITLIFLEKKDESGFQILKELAQHFHCILSQGTFYPLLYRLEKENKIIKKNGKGREIIYSLTPKTKKEIKLKKEASLKGYQHLASFFETAGGGRY